MGGGLPAGSAVIITLLGPPTFHVGRQVVALSPLERALLTRLALAPDRAVATDTLIDAIWVDPAPASARTRVQALVSSIRRTFTGLGVNGLVLSQPPGYRLCTDVAEIDLVRFEDEVRLATAALAEGRPADAAGWLREALRRWTGSPLAGIDCPFAEPSRIELVERHLRVVQERVRLDLELGRPEVVADLAGLVAAHPLQERLRAQLMTALIHTGRRVEALQVYREYARTLADEHGLDPGAELRELNRRALGAPTQTPTPPPVTTSQPDAVIPAQLPLDVGGFAGRADELARLDELVAGAGGHTTAVVITTLLGTPGVGKTALAVHWAHRVAHRFPDGQLYLDLRGFGRDRPPVTAAEAVRTLLDALDVAPRRVPHGLDAQVGLYRSLLTGRRMLVLLDNAHDDEQVRPLLPGSAGCLVLVTSRNRLIGLVASEAAHPVVVDALTDAEARDLLVARLGADRVAAEPDAVKEIIAVSGGLPLALVVMAARALARPGFPLVALVDELRADGGGLRGVDGGEPDVDIARVFSWSYEALTVRAARVFRLLGTSSGPDVDAVAAAAMAGVSVAAVRSPLAELTEAHLLTEPTPGRYGFHDLLRVYAGERSTAEDPATVRHAALLRLLDHYLHSAYNAALAISPHREPVPPAPPADGVPVHTFVDDREATAWVDAEMPVLLGLVDLATTHRFDRHVTGLAWSLTDFLQRRARWGDQLAVHTAALAAAARAGDAWAESRAHRHMSRALILAGRLDEAHEHFDHALRLADRLDDRAGRAHVHLNVANLLERQGRDHECLAHARAALVDFTAVDNRSGQARALNMIGWFLSRVGEHEDAMLHCRRAIPLLEAIGDREGLAYTWDSLGAAQARLGDHDEARRSYDRAVELFAAIGDRYYEAVALHHAGDVARAAGDLPAARRAWRRARDTFADLADPTAAELDEILRATDPAARLTDSPTR